MNDMRNAMTKGPPGSALIGPILAEARYPDVLVAHALSGGEDLRLVLYPGAAPGPQHLKIRRLRPGGSYEVRGSINNGSVIVADAHGAAELAVNLDGRTAFALVPAGL
jgi:hypothetical protein